jgi:hypothetical protein
MLHKQPGPVRCPACGKQALPFETRCLHCNARLNEVLPAEPPAGAAVPAAPPAPPPVVDGKCPGCGKDLAAGAVLCIECGYDVRTGHKRATVHAVADEEPEPAAPRQQRRREPLPAGLGRVQIGLGFHYARLVLALLAVLVLMALTGYGVATGARADDPGLIVGGMAAAATVLLAAALGLVGSVLCLWVGRPSRAWGLIFASLLLDVLSLPLVVYLHLAELPPLPGWAVEFVSWVFFMLFLRRLAVYIDRPGEANELMALITRGVALLVAVPLFLVLLGQFAFLYGTFSVATARLILMAGALVLVVQFIFLVKLFFSIMGNIQTLRAAIASRLPGG